MVARSVVNVRDCSSRRDMSSSSVTADFVIAYSLVVLLMGHRNGAQESSAQIILADHSLELYSFAHHRAVRARQQFYPSLQHVLGAPARRAIIVSRGV